MPKIKTNNTSLYYETRGDGESLLLIPGLGSDSASWAGACEKLARHFRVIAIDNRGSGRSDVPTARYSIRDMADDAAGILDHLRIKRCHVLGHSMGGYIAQELAIRYPERVGKLVLEATAPVSSARNTMLLTDLLTRFERDHDTEALVRSWAYWLFSPKTFERKNYVATFIQEASVHPYAQSAAGFRGQIDAIASFDARRSIKRIKTKTLVIIGADDILIYPAESMELVAGIRGSIFERMPETGHCVHIEDPDAFASKVVRFLKQ